MNTIRYAERLKEFLPEEEYAKLASESGGSLPKAPEKKKPKAKKPPVPKDSKKKPVKVVTRAKWGKIDRVKYSEGLKPSENVDDDDGDDENQEDLMRTKKGELEDWKLLKQTLRSGGEDDFIPMDLQEKADMLLEKKEELISKHMKYIRQVALMLKQEGELITQVQGPE